MAKTVTVTHLGMQGEGPTVAKAKKDAEARIEAALSGKWDPHFIVHKGLVAVIVRQPTGGAHQWGFKVLNTTEKEPIHNQWVDLNYSSRAETVRAAAYSLAQMTDTYAGLKPYLLDTQLSELDRYFDWQAAYRLHSQGGKSDNEARAEADKVVANLYKVAA